MMFKFFFLKKTPKIISLVKKWNPDIRLIGFKLLVDVSKGRVTQDRASQSHKNQAEIIVANDLTDISNHEHKAYLVRKETVTQAQSKEEIAQLLYLHIHSP